MRPRDVNNAIRTMMAQIATGIDNSEFGGVPQFHPATAAGPATLDFAEDTDNGTNRIRLSAPASIASDITVTLPAVAGTLTTGPTSTTDNTLARFDGTSGALQGSLVTVDDSGNISSFGGQIKFPATQSASSDANTLDDYEVGTYTPPWTNGGSIGNGSIVGEYVKIGDFVSASVVLTGGSTTTWGSGGIWSLGLPFANGGSQPTAMAYAFDSGTAHYAGAAIGPSGGSSTVTFASSGSGSNWTTTAPFTWTTNDRLQFTMNYRA